MTATILKPQANQTTRTIGLTIPVDAPDPKFNFGDRVVAIDYSDPEDTDVQAGIICGIRLSGGSPEDYEWVYELDPRGDKLSERFNTCDYQEDFAWKDELELQFFDETAIDAIYAAPIKSHEQIMREYEEAKAFFDSISAQVRSGNCRSVEETKAALRFDYV